MARSLAGKAKWDVEEKEAAERDAVFANVKLSGAAGPGNFRRAEKYHFHGL